MGMNSQIYVRYNKDGLNYLVAKDYPWNYSTSLISRCRYTIEWAKKRLDKHNFFLTIFKEIKYILDVNFDIKDIVLGTDLVSEYYEYGYKYCKLFNTYIFRNPNNDVGKLLIDINEGSGSIKYAFLDSDCNTDNIMSAAEYMDCLHMDDWRKAEYISDETKTLCESNLKTIDEISTVMTKEEVEDFINCYYS